MAIEQSVQPLISVIVPVYNVECYLEECLYSIQHQSYKNLEVILINDGSTDSSGDICDRYVQEDSRFQVHHVPNAGGAAAKNIGLDHATGEYIVIVDADDIAMGQQIEKLYQYLIENQADIAIGDYFLYSEADQLFHYYVFDENYMVETIDAQTAINRQLEHHFNTATYIVPWCKLYKRSLFENVRFPEGRKFDDEFTTHKLYLNADKIVVAVENLYMYRVGHGSQMYSGFSMKLAQDVIRAFESKLADVSLAGLDTRTICLRFTYVLYDYKNMMESYGMTDTNEYKEIIWRISLLEKQESSLKGN